MSLQSLIQNGNYDSAQAAFDAITTPSIERRDDQLYTWAGVALIAGPVGAETLRIALQENGMGWVVHQLGGRGIQLSNELVQQALLGFAEAGLPGCAELAATGISSITPWQSAGIAEPTLEQVTEAFNAEQRRLAYESICTRANAAIEAAAEAYRASDPTIEEIVAAGVEAFGV
jgi:hypothetical protein